MIVGPPILTAGEGRRIACEQVPALPAPASIGSGRYRARGRALTLTEHAGLAMSALTQPTQRHRRDRAAGAPRGTSPQSSEMTPNPTVRAPRAAFAAAMGQTLVEQGNRAVLRPGIGQLCSRFVALWLQHGDDYALDTDVTCTVVGKAGGNGAHRRPSPRCKELPGHLDSTAILSVLWSPVGMRKI